VGSVEIGNRDIRRRRAGIGYCRNLGNCGGVVRSCRRPWQHEAGTEEPSDVLTRSSLGRSRRILSHD
jgi:hypothetical protein